MDSEKQEYFVRMGKKYGVVLCPIQDRMSPKVWLHLHHPESRNAWGRCLFDTAGAADEFAREHGIPIVQTGTAY